MVGITPAAFPVAVGYVVAAALATSIATYGVVHRDNRVARALGAVMGAVLLWTLGALWRLFAPGMAAWYGLTALMYLGVAATAVLFFVFVMHYTNRGQYLTRGRVAALLFVPAVTVVAVLTNPEHGLFFGEIRTVTFGGADVLYAGSGPLFWVHTAYSYLLLAAGTLLLFGFALDHGRVYRRQSLAILGGALVPWAANVVYLLYVDPSFPVDPTPVGFAVGGVLVAYAVFGTGVTNLTPAARSAVVDAIDDAVFVVGREDELVDLNPAARRLATVEDPLGEPVAAVVPESVLDASEGPRSVTVGGETRWYRLREVALGDDVRVLLAVELTEQVRRERQLREQNRRLERFTRVAAHDLRNPLNAINGYARLARETGDVSHLEDVDSATDRIETLVDDLLTLGHEGRVVEETAPVSLASTAERAWTGVDTEGATLETVGDDRILADEDRLGQLLENLFVNAVEHGSTSPPSQAQEDAVEHGSTSSRPEADDAVSHGGDVTVRVGPSTDGFFIADDGCGIPPEERGEVFEYGYSTHGGTGLGLPVVRSIAVAHGWEVSVAEGSDGGARIEFAGVRADPGPFDETHRASAAGPSTE
jgi:signal transduction histidine kinase